MKLRLVSLFLLALLACGATTQDAKTVERKVTVAERQWPGETLQIEEWQGLGDADFPQRLSLTVRNVSDQPVYFALVALDMKGSAPHLGTPKDGVILLSWGDIKFGKFKKRAEAADRGLQPGETATLTPEPAVRNDFFKGLANREEFLRYGTTDLRVHFQYLSLGDGTFFLKKKKAPEPPEDEREHGPFVPQEGAPCHRMLFNIANSWCGQEPPVACSHITYHCYDCEGGLNGTIELRPQSCGCPTMFVEDCPPSEG